MQAPVDISNFFVQQRKGRTRLVWWPPTNLWPSRVHPTQRTKRAIAGLTLPRAPSYEAILAADAFAFSYHPDVARFDLRKTHEILDAVLRAAPPEITPAALVERTHNAFRMARDIARVIKAIEPAPPASPAPRPGERQ